MKRQKRQRMKNINDKDVLKIIKENQELLAYKSSWIALRMTLEKTPQATMTYEDFGKSMDAILKFNTDAMKEVISKSKKRIQLP